MDARIGMYTGYGRQLVMRGSSLPCGSGENAGYSMVGRRFVVIGNYWNCVIHYYLAVGREYGCPVHVLCSQLFLRGWPS